MLKYKRETHKLDVCTVILISTSDAQTLESYLQSGWVFVSGSDILKYWRVTHCLDVCSSSAVLVSFLLICSNTGEWLTAWMCVQQFSSVVLIYSNTREWLTPWMMCSAILVSDSDLLKHWRVTHILDHAMVAMMCVQPFLSVVLICSNTEERLTNWMCASVQSFLSVVLICSNTREWLTTWMSVRKWFWSAQTLESKLTFWMHIQPFLSVVLICSTNEE
jgi:hypothetical protein